MNTFKTSILMASLTALLLAAGFLLGGEGGLVIAVGFALFGNIFAYWNSDKMVLSIYGARQVDETSHPAYVGTVKQLAARAQLPMPKVYVVETPQPNAFATGRNPENAAVAATTGLLDNMSHQEIAGVMAHELAHVKNRDTLIMTITATLAGALSMLATVVMFFGGRSRNNPLGSLGTILVMILAPLAAMLVQMAISRTREYQADSLGAESTEMIATTEWTLSRRLGTLPAARAIGKATTDAKLASSPSSPTGVGIALIALIAS